MQLSKRAAEHLNRVQWLPTVKKEKEILKAFDAAETETTPQLIEFQTKYGGLTEYVGLEPITFGILQTKALRGDFANNKGKLIIEGPNDYPKGYRTENHFICADTLFQETFSITSSGAYYDSNIQCRNFDTFVEDLSMWEMLHNGNYEKAFDYKYDCDCDTTSEEIELAEAFAAKFNDFATTQALTTVEGVWDDLLLWCKAGDALIRKGSFNIKVFLKAGNLNALIIDKLKECFGEL